jgi:hypothetical protein
MHYAVFLIYQETVLCLHVARICNSVSVVYTFNFSRYDRYEQCINNSFEIKLGDVVLTLIRINKQCIAILHILLS